MLPAEVDIRRRDILQRLTVGKMKALFLLVALYSSSPILPAGELRLLPVRGGNAGRLRAIHKNQERLCPERTDPQKDCCPERRWASIAY